MGYYLYLPPVQPLSGGDGQENYELHQTSVFIKGKTPVFCAKTYVCSVRKMRGN